MPKANSIYDVVVVGAGTAGSACALGLARCGLKVALLEKKALDNAGACWINLIPRWILHQSGWWPLEKDELGSPPAVFHIAGPNGKPRVSLEGVELYPVRISVFLERLHQLCRQAGVKIFECVRTGRLVRASGRVTSLELKNPPRTLKANLLVDASGIQRALANQIPELAQPSWNERQLCSASQWSYRISNRQGALEFCHLNQIEPGETLTCNGLAGAFSTLSVHVDRSLQRVELLAGILGRSDVGKLIDEFVAKNRWAGKKLQGGGGLIPLRPQKKLYCPGLAVLGDAAGQVFAAHASGTGAGLMAAKLLVEACQNAAGPGDAEVLSTYARRWRKFAEPSFLAAAAFTAGLAGCGGELVAELLQLFSACPNLLRGGLEQRLELPDISSVVFNNCTFPATVYWMAFTKTDGRGHGVFDGVCPWVIVEW